MIRPNLNDVMEEMLKHNREFVGKNSGKKNVCKFPRKKTAIVACMDTRLLQLLPDALGIKEGDVKMIKNAGGTVYDDYDTTMRSLLIAIYELQVDKVMIIAHTGCGVQGMRSEHIYHLMEERGIPRKTIEDLKASGVNLDKWLTGFDDTDEAVRESVLRVRNHPLIPRDVTVRGFVIDTETGKLTEIEA